MSRIRGRLALTSAVVVVAALAGSAAAGAVPSRTPGEPTSLPRVAWEGGPAYWSQFSRAHAAGFDDPSVFPISVFYNVGDTDAEVAWDKHHVGLNTYVQGNSSIYDAAPAEKYGMFTFGGRPDGNVGARQVGNSLDDEIDGQYDLDAGLAKIDDEADASPDGVANYVNWTSGVVSYDRSEDFSDAYLNNPRLALNSLDQYFYAAPQCSWGANQLRWRTPTEAVSSRGVPGTAITPANCRTASSYGKMIDLQREVDNDDGELKPIWALVEVISPGGGTHGWHQPKAAQVVAAAYDSIVHEARGIVWFDQAPENADHNDCATGSALRDARLGHGCPAIARNVAAVSAFDAWIATMAPILNTQSYVWKFGGVDTMLKIVDHHAYVFASTLDRKTGMRTFHVPPGMAGAVDVLGEHRTLRIRDGAFTDRFAHEWSHHTYRIRLS